MKRLQGESRTDKLACRYDRAAAPDAEGVKDGSQPKAHIFRQKTPKFG